MPFDTFELAECRDSDECIIDKGSSVHVASWSFTAKSKSTTARLSVLIGYVTADGKRSAVYELEMNQPDLCQLDAYQNGLAKKPLTNTDRRECDIEPTKLYQLAENQEFYVAKQLPSVNVFPNSILLMLLIVFQRTSCIALALLLFSITVLLSGNQA